MTGHVWNAYDQPGPFVDINTLKWGDKIIVHLNGESYVFEVPLEIDRKTHGYEPDREGRRLFLVELNDLS